MPFASKRSVASFQRARDYDWSDGRRKIAEVTIAGGVLDAWSYVESVELWCNAEHLALLKAPYDYSLIERLSA